MRIYDSSLTGTASQEAARAHETQQASTSGSGRTSTGASGTEDHVDFSNTLGSLARAVSSDQTSRASRIQALTAQVQNGTYQPNPSAISRGMVSEALAGGVSGS